MIKKKITDYLCKIEEMALKHYNFTKEAKLLFVNVNFLTYYTISKKI